MVDRLVERAPDLRFEAVEGIVQVVAIEDEAAVGTPATDRRIGVPDRGIAAATDVGEGRARGGPDGGVGDGPAPDECVVLGPGVEIAGDDGCEIEPTEMEWCHRVRLAAAGRPGAAVTGRSSRSGGQGSPMPRPP